ncbi:MAG: hypothetical protein HYY61_04285 [Deltaproteobacteria bacterium]|nr:hypothetical protein [Deltaproteobacteria bacterium]
MHPQRHRMSFLPLSCQNQYQTLHPLTLPHLLAEREKVASRALFEAQFYTMLRTDEELGIPVLISETMVRKLIEIVPDWKQEQGWLSAEDQQAQVQQMIRVMRGVENQLTTYAISWYLQSQNEIPFEWKGTQEELELKMASQLVATKKMLLLTIVERMLWDSKADVSSEVKRQIVSLVEEASQGVSKDEGLKATSHRICQANPKMLVEDQLRDYLELTQKIIAQDQKISQLKGGSVFPPVEDTPENFKIASLIFSSQLTDAISKESFDEIEKVLFEEGSTYEAAFDRYQKWLMSFEGDKKIKEDMKKIASVFRLTRTWHLSEVFKDHGQRVLFEEALRGLLVIEEPLLETEIEYEGHARPLYLHFGEAVQQKKSDAVFVELVQRALWNKKQLVEYEVDRFCKLDSASTQGLEFLLANTSFRRMALSKFPGFDGINEKVMDHLHEELSEGKFEQAIGYGFLTVIGLSFVSGPLSRLPWWLGGRWIPKIPYSLLKSGHVFILLGRRAGHEFFRKLE